MSFTLIFIILVFFYHIIDITHFRNTFIPDVLNTNRFHILIVYTLTLTIFDYKFIITQNYLIANRLSCLLVMLHGALYLGVDYLYQTFHKNHLRKCHTY